MDDGNAFPGNWSPQSPGHDIGPDEDRHNMNSEMMPVDVVSNHHVNEFGGMEVEYQSAFVQRRNNGLFQEPLDESPVDLLPPDHPRRWNSTDKRFALEENRLKTFLLWSDEYPVRGEDLARDGFIFIGPGDRVKCVFCYKTLRGWERGDVVEKEHKRIYPDCPWVKGQCFHINVPINREMALKKSLGLKMKETHQASAQSEQRSTHTASAESEQRSMETFAERNATFPSDWAEFCPVRADALAHAGFFYTGRHDAVTCFACHRVISHWAVGDDPWNEHARLSPNCPLLMSVRETDRKPNFTPAGNMLKHEPTKPAAQGHYATPSFVQAPSSLHYPQQVSTASIENDLQSPAVQALCAIEEDISMDEIRRRLERIRLAKGPGYHIKSEDLMEDSSTFNSK